MCDLTCDVITCCVWSCDIVKSMYMIKSWLKIRKKDKIWKSKIQKSPSKRSFTNGIHSLLKWADPRESADIIYLTSMYKTAVYTLVNSVITHQKQQISQKWYYAAWHCLSVNVLLSNITFFDICCFWCVMTPLTRIWSFPTNIIWDIFMRQPVKQTAYKNTA